MWIRTNLGLIPYKSRHRLPPLSLQREIRLWINAGPIEQSPSDRNRSTSAEGKIEGVAWAAVELLDLTITVGSHPREESTVHDSQHVGSHNMHSMTIEYVDH